MAVDGRSRVTDKTSQTTPNTEPFAPQAPDLLQRHYDHIKASGIADDVIRERGYRSILGKVALKDLGFAPRQRLAPGILLPLWAPDGSNPLDQFKPDKPRLDTNGDVNKYETPAKAGMRLDCPPRCRPLLNDPKIPLHLTEGIKKSDCLASHGYCAIDLLGVWNWRGRGKAGGKAWLEDWDYVALNDRDVYLVFDSDVTIKPDVQKALERLLGHLKRHGADPVVVILPSGPNGEKMGVDDYLVANGRDEYERTLKTCALLGPNVLVNAAPKQNANGVEANAAAASETPPDLPVPPDGEFPTLTLEIIQGFHVQSDSDEYGDAQTFAYRYRDAVVYDHSEKLWYLWNGHHWQEDRSGTIRRLIAGQLPAAYLRAAADLKAQSATAGESAKIEAEGAIDRLLSRVKKLRERRRIDNVLSLSTALLGITGDEWDGDPWLLGVKNGVLDLRSGECRAGRPADYIRTVAPTEWRRSDEPAPQWERFIAEILEQDDQEATKELPPFIQRLLGYGLVGSQIDHVVPLLWGKGRNGKDTLLEVLRSVLGKDLAEAVSEDVMISNRERGGSATPHLMDLRGKRLAWVSETNEGARLNVARVKKLVGGGTQSGRPLYGRTVFWEPSHLLMLVTNARPVVDADDYALWKRLLLIPFTRQFVENPTPETSERKADPRLREKLKAEASGILAWLVRGALAWQRKGLNPPTCVRLATKEYQQDEDILSDFIRDRCVVEQGRTVRAGALFSAYRDWATEAGTPERYQLSNRAFGEKVKSRFERRENSQGKYYRGIGLLSDPESQQELPETPPDPPEKPPGKPQQPAPDQATFDEAGHDYPLSPTPADTKMDSVDSVDSVDKNLPHAHAHVDNSCRNYPNYPHYPPGETKVTYLTFTPTHEWQEVPDGAILPPGLEIKMNMATGKNQARLSPEKVIRRDEVLALAEQHGWPDLSFGAGEKRWRAVIPGLSKKRQREIYEQLCALPTPPSDGAT